MGLADARVASLERQLADLETRFERLGGLRAEYANAVAQTENHTALLEAARGTLSDARASQAAARAASLIDSIGAPDTGIYPVGPRRATIVLVGLIGGLFAGFGVMFLTADPVADASEPEPEVSIVEVPWKKNGHAGALRATCQPAGTVSLKQALAKVTHG